MKTKFVINLSLVVVHPDGTKVRKKVLANYLRGLLEGDDGTDYLRVSKVVVRSVDAD